MAARYILNPAGDHALIIQEKFEHLPAKYKPNHQYDYEQTNLRVQDVTAKCVFIYRNHSDILSKKRSEDCFMVIVLNYFEHLLENFAWVTSL
jgi:hypothetical protein